MAAKGQTSSWTNCSSGVSSHMPSVSTDVTMADFPLFLPGLEKLCSRTSPTRENCCLGKRWLAGKQVIQSGIPPNDRS